MEETICGTVGIRVGANLTKKVIANLKVRRELECEGLQKALDVVFSRYIRMRDADENGKARCVTCGKEDRWGEMDCGHFIPRDRLVVRYNMENAHAQCKRCNRYRSGEQYLHGEAIKKMHGAGAVERLTILAAMKFYHDPPWYIAQIDMFRELCKNFQKNKKVLNDRPAKRKGNDAGSGNGSAGVQAQISEDGTVKRRFRGRRAKRRSVV